MTVTATPGPTGHPGYSETLPRQPESAAVARRLVRTALAAWGLEDLAEDAALVITELVSNASDHARLESIRVIVSRSGENRVRIGVVDRSRVTPERRTDSNGDQTRGRGLMIVDSVTECWGADLYPWGKQVWGELRCGKAPS
ncbi:ATP-binding protein [Streptomyces paludis]|uniref:ATP-binding protein n=1 Tax=Streptomyces paludis TaxID=2282738 RepID=A0A345HMZ6_9ACTN|nr:ATP-binding protein [Streptomyces paludis]AXG78070.1 ATP-binding protein [Streptomyces paludis]